MSGTKTRIEKNLEYAQRWLDRAIKDFDAFKRLAHFDRKTRKTIRCSDPALAVYLLQQSVEKAVKAVAIASGQYKTNDFINYYKHNSLALILNLDNRIIEKINLLGLKPVTDLMGVDLASGALKLRGLEEKALGDKLNSTLKTESIRAESVRISPEVIDQVLDMVIKIRSLFLDAVRSAFGHLPELGIRKGRGTVEAPEAFVRTLSDRLTADLKSRSLPEALLKAPLEFQKILSNFGVQSTGGTNRTAMITNYLGVWSLSTALLFLTYFTFAHESISRYPRKPGEANKVKTDKLGCEDYDDSLGVVNRIGRLGYVTGLTLNEMKEELETIALFFATKSAPSSTGTKGGGHGIQ